MSSRPILTIVGAGHVGTMAALWAAQDDLADIVLLNPPDSGTAAEGQALDLQESAPIRQFGSRIRATHSYADTAGSHVVIITAGMPRKPGMSRDDLLKVNAGVVKSVAQEVAKTSPDAVIIVVTNPLDAMTYVAWKASGFPAARVVGQAGVLDTARYRTFIAEELNVHVEDVSALLLGGHGDAMVPLPRYTTVGGIPVTQLLSKEKLNAIVQRTRDGGAEIVNLLQTGSASYAPGAAAVQMARAIIRDEHRVLPACAHLNGEYGVTDTFVGVPVVLGATGVEKVLSVELNEEEKAMFQKSVDAVKELMQAL